MIYIVSPYASSIVARLLYSVLYAITSVSEGSRPPIPSWKHTFRLVFGALIFLLLMTVLNALYTIWLIDDMSLQTIFNSSFGILFDFCTVVVTMLDCFELRKCYTSAGVLPRAPFPLRAL